MLSAFGNIFKIPDLKKKGTAVNNGGEALWVLHAIDTRPVVRPSPG